MSTTEISPTDFAPLPEPAVRRRTPIGGDPAPDWRVAAACLHHDLNTFFPISNVGVAAQQQIAEAKGICAGCPVQQDCLDWALQVGPEFGIFGGHTEDERRALRSSGGAGGRWEAAPVVLVHRSEQAVAEALEPR